MTAVNSERECLQPLSFHPTAKKQQSWWDRLKVIAQSSADRGDRRAGLVDRSPGWPQSETE
jgi:hypothetical protein